MKRISGIVVAVFALLDPNPNPKPRTMPPRSWLSLWRACSIFYDKAGAKLEGTEAKDAKNKVCRARPQKWLFSILE